MSLLNCKEEDIILISAKTGENLLKLLEKIISKFPSPRPLKIQKYSPKVA